MSTSAHYPKACVLCCYFMLPEDAQDAIHTSPNIGPVCEDCSDHCVEAVRVLMHNGIASHAIADGDRNDICPPKFLRQQEDQP